MTALAPAYTGTQAEVFTGVFADYYFRVKVLNTRRLYRPDHHLAEDLTQDTFLELWEKVITRGTVINDQVFGLLATIARHHMWWHMSRMRAREIAVDFTDPAESAARMQAPPADVPHLADLYEQLDHAKDDLAEAARAYKAAAKPANVAASNIKRAKDLAKVEHWTIRARELGEVADTALGVFKAAADRVADLRAAWDTAAETVYSQVVVNR